MAAKVEKLVIKKRQEEKKFDTLSETLQLLLMKLDDEPANKVNISEAADDNLHQLDECFKACEEINYQLLLILDSSLHENENSWFTDKLKSHNSLRFKWKASITRREVVSTDSTRTNSR